MLAIDPLACHADGEPFVLEADREARVEVVPGVLRVAMPPAASPR
ncbi:MAG TPA: hypothetical protein VFT91_02975 [Dehalococcoidia bacterium]|nr:hypothetical protein [Dehalococcoidia bacterium]